MKTSFKIIANNMVYLAILFLPLCYAELRKGVD
jgi:hypothetical protein